MVRTDFGELQEKYRCLQGREGGVKHVLLTDQVKCDLRDGGGRGGGFRLPAPCENVTAPEKADFSQSKSVK